MSRINKVIFVCTENTCRSIMAESVMKSVCRDQDIDIASRGLIVLFPEPLNPKAVAVLTSNHMPPARKNSEVLSVEDLDEDTLVLTMTEKEKQMVEEGYPEAVMVFTLGAFAGRPVEIEEPHGGSLAEYGACYEYIDLLVKLAAETIFKTNGIL